VEVCFDGSTDGSPLVTHSPHAYILPPDSFPHLLWVLKPSLQLLRVVYGGPIPGTLHRGLLCLGGNGMKVMLADIESSPLITYNWGLYEQDAIKKIKSFTILSFAYKWLDEPVQVLACDTMSEKKLLGEIWKLLDEADLVIAHNGDSFDIKKINTRFIIHKMSPPSPYKTIDTKKVAKSVAAFDSNSLNNLGIDMDEGEKIKHRGFDMWEGCMAGVQRDWDDMKRYNKQDVVLLEKVYKRLVPWIKNHPRVSDKPNSCPNCGSSKIQSRGEAFTKHGKYNRFVCECGKWLRGIVPIKRIGGLVSA